MHRQWRRQSGFTVIELVIIMLMIGVVVTVGVRRMSSSIDAANYEHTKAELDALATAIAGNPSLYVNGARSDFGYVGDIGALPPNLDALVSNPGSYATWDGPYITSGDDVAGFKTDAWGSTYSLNSTSIRSSGSGSDIDRAFASSTAELLSNTVSGFIRDAARKPPGSGYQDSVVLRLTYPDGTGGHNTATTTPSIDGSFSFSGIPIGRHSLEIVFLPTSDTTRLDVAVGPAATVRLEPVIAMAAF